MTSVKSYALKNSTKPQKIPCPNSLPLLLILCRVFVTTKKNRCKQLIICVSFVIKAVFSGKKKAKRLISVPKFSSADQLSIRNFSLKMGVA